MARPSPAAVIGHCKRAALYSQARDDSAGKVRLHHRDAPRSPKMAILSAEIHPRPNGVYLTAITCMHISKV